MIPIPNLIEIEEFSGTPQEWDAFIADAPSSFSHRHAWMQIIARVYGGVPYYLAARQQGKIIGVLPLMLRRAIGAGKYLSSVPYADEGGLCITDPAAEAPLLDAAEALGTKLGAGYVELRQIQVLQRDLPCDKTRVSLKLELPDDEETLWTALLPKVRNRVRKAKKSGLQAAVVDASEAAVQDVFERVFYPVYSENTRDLGSPMHSRAFFQAFMADYSGAFRIITVCEGSTPVGSAIGVIHNRIFSVPWIACLREYFPKAPNNLLYWQMMQTAIELGCETFDFGRSPKGSGPHRFKCTWGVEEQQLHYAFMPLKRTPDCTEKQDGMAYRAFSKVWCRTPLPIAQKIGPAIFRHLPL